MTKQQLREAIRRVIKQELLNEALYLPPMQVAYFEGYDDAKKGKPADVNYYRQYMEPDKTSLNEMPGLKIFNKDDSALEAFKKGYKYGFKDGRLGEMTLKNALSLDEAKNYPKAGENGNVKVSQLKKGDILAATGDEIVSVSAGAKTPSDKLEVTTKNSKGNTSTKEWGKNNVVKLKNKTNEGPAVAPKPGTEEDIETKEDEDNLIFTEPKGIPEPQAEEDIIKKILARYAASSNERKN
jgi:hypothetical protein